jgi:hypothetical protein
MIKEPRMQFSKILTLGSLCLFIWALFKGFTTDFTVIYDTTVYVTAITISGGIFGVCLKSYMSKSKAENIYKVQRAMYEDIMNIKLQYNENMMQLSQKYNMTQDDIDMMDNISPINDGVDGVLNDMRENIDNHLYDTKQEDEIENYY